ncbi:MAG: class I SAM-dependent methyltransferase [Chloroflexi bacterium]|nr:class I SAM-dependent methyltransferase [Chloroflexota bacterium]
MMGAEGASSPTPEYDRHYAAGGFGYEERRGHWLAWARRHYVEAFDLPTGRLLDVGCGDGFWTSIFRDLGFEATGVDVSPGGIATARSKYPESTFLVADADGPLPFEAASFDVIFCRAISHFGEPDLEAPRVTSLIPRLMALLAPGGVLLASYHTVRDGGTVHGRTYHPVSTLVRLFEHGGDPYRVELVGNYVQVGVRHPGAPTRSSGDRATSIRPGGGPTNFLRRVLGKVRRRLEQ